MKRRAICFVLLGLLILTLIVVNICVGSVSIEPGEIWNIIKNGDHESVAGRILLDIRLPRVVETMFLGGGLALSGYLLQSFFSNPIAGPYILGISSGAKLVVALLMVASMNAGFVMSSWMMVIAAFVGSLMATGLVIGASAKVRSMSILIVCGVMIGYICSAVTELVVAFADDSNIVNLHNWSQGTFSAAAREDAYYYIPIVTACLVASLMLGKAIEAYGFGENYAITVGIRVKRFRILLILVSSVLSATVTAFAGPVSFVGIAMPHVARTLFRSTKPRVVIPASFLLGSGFCRIFWPEVCLRPRSCPSAR